PDLQPASIVIADIEAICLRQLTQRGLEQPDGTVGLTPVVRIGEKGARRQCANQGAQLRHVRLEAVESVGACSIHGGGRRRSCRRMKGRDLYKYQTRGEGPDEGHPGGRYRDSERQHPISSAGGKKGTELQRRRGSWRPPVCGIAEGHDSHPRAARPTFDPADFGQIAALKVESKTGLRST